ncbi:hypothetical protein F4680DRAFT_419640 [Xylaria scruposa]|nr:hypothetical protein F4680DRAFT_419640 [Xylaria scruposa]
MGQKGKDRKLAHWKYWGPWRWETIFFLISVSLSAATVAVLAKYDGEIQPKWPYNITLSAFTALLTTIIRSLLLIILEEVIGHSRWSWFEVPRPLYHLEILDQASRGPWGALNYLARVRRLHPSTIAATVLVLSLGISTFTQQAIRSIPCIKADSTDEAWVRTAQIIYTNDDGLVLPNIDLAATEALFQGRDTNNRQSSFYCPSGNCTFGAADEISYSSLGVCSKCVDVSLEMDYVTTNHTPVAIDVALSQQSKPLPNRDIYCRWPKRNSTTEDRLGPDTIIGAFTCNASNCLMPQSSEVDASYSYSVANFSSYWALNRSEDNWDPHVSQDPTFVARFGMVTAVLSGIGAEAGVPPVGKACNIPGQWDDEPISLNNKSGHFYLTCWLYPCIKHYNGLVSNGRLQETIIKTDLLPLQTNQMNPDDGSAYDVYGSYIDSCSINGMRANHSQTPPLFTGDNYSPNNSQSTDLNCWYGFTGSLPMLFSQPLPTNWIHGIPLGLGTYWMNYLLGLPWYLRSDLMDPFDTISTGIDNVATTMTNALREIGNNSYGGASKANGTVLRAAVCTEIDWPWISFPAAILLATLYIIVHTVTDSLHDSSPVRTWKSSALPMLYYGLKRESQKGELESRHDLAHDAKRRKVCLRRDIKGDWGLEDDTTRPSGES